MPLTSDIQVAAAKFQPSAVSAQTTELNKHLVNIFAPSPKWYEIGAAAYRLLRLNGETALPAPKYLDAALEIEVLSREAGRNIACRLIYPRARKTEEERKNCNGSVLHIHGGGWVLGDHKSADVLLQQYADAGDLAVLSLDYRLAPENPFPKGPEDCIDLGEHLIKNSEKEYGGPLRFIGGESAGAHLSLLVTFHLLRVHPAFNLTGLLLHFGVYDLSLLPSARSYTKPLILNRIFLEKFTDAFVPPSSSRDLKDPSISPYYEPLDPFRGRLPNALFTCGTDDPLVDDNVNMGVKWMITGGKAVVKFYPGAPHAFVGFERGVLEEAGQAVDDTVEFIGDCLAGV